MAQIEYIKFLYEEEGKSLTQIAKELKMNFRTVKKYAQEYNWSPNIKQRKKRNYPALGDYIDIIDAWLTVDLQIV